MDEDGVWRTIGGRRIFIKDGEDLATAMKKSGKFKTKNSKKTSKEENKIKETKETKDEKKEEKPKEEQSQKKNSELTDEERTKRIEELEKQKEQTQSIFQRGAIQQEIEMVKDKFDGTKEEYREYKSKKEEKSLEEYKKEKEARKNQERETKRKENEKKYKNIKVEEVNEKDMQQPKAGYIRLYRGLNDDFDKSYDRTSVDNPNGYESWTDNRDLAKAYGKNVYYMDVPKNEIGTEVADKEGNRYMTYVHDKKVGMGGKSGKEYMMYTDHDKYLKSTYTKINEDTPKKSSNNIYLKAYNEYKKEHPNSKLTFNAFKKNME